MRISDWSSDVCSSDLVEPAGAVFEQHRQGDRPGCLPAIVPRRVGKALPQRVIERYQPLPRGNLDRQRREHLGYRADLVENGRATVGTPVPNAHLLCRALLENKTTTNDTPIVS